MKWLKSLLRNTPFCCSSLILVCALVYLSLPLHVLASADIPTYDQTIFFAHPQSGFDSTTVIRSMKDAANNVYVTGTFSGTVAFGPGDTDLQTSIGSVDFFVTKFNADHTYAWTKTVGGTDRQLLEDAAIDSSGNLYLVGTFNGTANFNPGGVDSRTAADYDAFISKWSSNGDYAWTKIIGDTNSETIQGISIHGNDIYVAGNSDSPSINFNPDGDDTHSLSDVNLWVSKWDTAGTYEWTDVMSTAAGALYAVSSLASDSSSSVFVAGSFSGSDVNFAPSGSDLRTSNGSRDIFVTKLDTTGDYAWTKTIGGDALDAARRVATDASDNIYIAGVTTSGDLNLDPGGSDVKPTFANQKNVLLSKWNNNGAYQWSKAIIGSDPANQSDVDSLDIGQNGRLYLGGNFSGSLNFNPDGSDTHDAADSSGSAYVSAWDLTGGYNWTVTFGGSTSFDYISATNVLTDSNGHFFVPGNAYGTNNFNFNGSDVFETDSVFLSLWHGPANSATAPSSLPTTDTTGISILNIKPHPKTYPANTATPSEQSAEANATPTITAPSTAPAQTSRSSQTPSTSLAKQGSKKWLIIALMAVVLLAILIVILKKRSSRPHQSP